MPRHPQEPHLFTVRMDGVVVGAIRAMSQAEARDYWLSKHVVIERPTPIEAFRIGSLLAVEIEAAKPEYAIDEDGPQLDLLDKSDSAGPEGDA